MTKIYLVRSDRYGISAVYTNKKLAQKLADYENYHWANLLGIKIEDLESQFYIDTWPIAKSDYEEKLKIEKNIYGLPF